MAKNNDTLMTFIVDKDKNTRLFYFEVFDTKEDVPGVLSYMFGVYLYAYELSGNIIIGKTDSKHVVSMTSWSDGRVALLGPIRDADWTMEEIESFIDEFKTGENPGTYKFDSLEQFIGNPYANGRDSQGIFQIIQMNFSDGFKGQDHALHSSDKGIVVRDLIIPDKNARMTLVVFKTENGIRKGEELTAIV